MNREQYIEMLKTNRFDISLIYEYYNTFNKNTSFTFDINTIQQLLFTWALERKAQSPRMTHGRATIKTLNISCCKRRLLFVSTTDLFNA
jgi:hypothetical protein